MKKIVCYGEVLWDMLPTGKKLGGAPLNVALRAQSLGDQTAVISSIGEDEAGKEIIAEMKLREMNMEHIQTSNKFETSEVQVTLNTKGSATYEIKMPCAWDDIQLSEDNTKAVEEADAFIYGSLVARRKQSCETLLSLLKKSKFNIFDINLRPPHYTYERLEVLMKHAHFIKLNDDEVFEICENYGFHSQNMENCIRFISESTDTHTICVTLGENGAVLFSRNKFTYNKGYKITVADTVGAGDSFLATIVSKLLNGTEPQEAINYASAVGAIVASKKGANPFVSQEEIQKMIS